MLTTKNPDFESIADAVYFLTENRELIDIFLDYEARQAYNRQREKLIQEQSARITELEQALAEMRHNRLPGIFSKWKNFFRKH